MNEEIQKEITIPCAVIKLRKDNILHIHVTLTEDFELENSKEIFVARNELTNNTAYPHLYTGGKFLNPSDEVTQFAASEERNELVVADAYVIHSLAQRIIANFYLKFRSPIRPTKFFTDEDKAITWLSSFVN